MKFLVVNGPNLNWLGRRARSVYGVKTLADIEAAVSARASELGVDVGFFQSNHEGAIVEHLQAESGGASGLILNAGALTHYGLALRDALADSRLPVVEVHMSNIYAREEFRHHSVVAPLAVGQIAGLGWYGYVLALEFLASRSSDLA